MEEAHELTSMIANSNIQPPEKIIEQPFTRMTDPTPLTMERPSQSRPAQPSAPKQRSIYPIMKENWASDQARKCTGKHTICTYVVGYGIVWEDLCKAVKHSALRVFHKCEKLICVQVGLLRLQRLMEKPSSSLARLF
ncbi:hypothetical protein OUZ56_033798 [Daphnia magna]|uniref:Uncharacterized protein n=1 Tax=Daphnia magna TaxID=35525 RepID=A0ABR0BB52_9CRUS|nr:hypothetical protein OUZ56_033798 [Daphnia magna]